MQTSSISRPTADPAPTRAKVLMVDDRAENLLALEGILDDLDAELVRAGSGAEALKRVLSEDFALILLDVQMPEMDGYETARLIRSRPRSAHVPIIFLSAIDRDEHHALKGYGLGAVDFLPKPFNPEVLRAKTTVFLELHELRTRHQQAEALQARRARHALLRAELGEVLASEAPMREVLQAAMEAMVRHLDAAFARVWTVDAAHTTLELQASAGLYTHIDGGHARVPIGKFKIGRIAEDLEPHLTNDVLNDPRVGDPDWARREGMVAFAGHPLVVDRKLLGVVAMFAREALSPDVLEAIATISGTLAQGIARKQALLALNDRAEELAMLNEELLAQQSELLTLSEQLAEEKAGVERVVAERTEDLQAANEELAAQGEELEAQNEELEAAHQQLLAQAGTLAERSAFSESLIQHVPAAVAYLDRELVFRVTNPIYSRILGLPKEALQDRYLFDVLPGTEAQVEPLLRGVLETGEPFRASDFVFVYEKDGQEVTTYWDFIYQPLVLDPAKGPDGVLVLALDTSHRVEQERERELLREQQALERAQRDRIAALEETDRAKDQFLSVLSHELRTPLNAIQGFGSILEDGIVGDLPERQLEYLRKMMGASDVMLALVDDLLDLSRMQTGKFSLNREAVPALPPAAAAIASVEVLAQAKGLVLINEVAAGLPEVDADPVRLGQILTNLLTNAVKFTPAGGRIVVRAGVAGTALRFEVEDNGSGIAEAEHKRIFQAFTQVDMSSTRQVGGVGLGLSIVRGLVEAHGGDVGVRSCVGEGSTFWFTLPLAIAD